MEMAARASAASSFASQRDSLCSHQYTSGAWWRIGIKDVRAKTNQCSPRADTAYHAASRHIPVLFDSSQTEPEHAMPQTPKASPMWTKRTKTVCPVGLMLGPATPRGGALRPARYRGSRSHAPNLRESRAKSCRLVCDTFSTYQEPISTTLRGAIQILASRRDVCLLCVATPSRPGVCSVSRAGYNTSSAGS